MRGPRSLDQFVQGSCALHIGAGFAQKSVDRSPSKLKPLKPQIATNPAPHVDGRLTLSSARRSTLIRSQSILPLRGLPNSVP